MKDLLNEEDLRLELSTITLAKEIARRWKTSRKERLYGNYGLCYTLPNLIWTEMRWMDNNFGGEIVIDPFLEQLHCSARHESLSLHYQHLDLFIWLLYDVFLSFQNWVLTDFVMWPSALFIKQEKNCMREALLKNDLVSFFKAAILSPLMWK